MRHFVYVSITGVDRVPFAYYRAKHAAERLVEQSAIPFTIVRLTQFHDLLDVLFAKLFQWRIAPLPGRCLLQPMDAREAALRVAEASSAKPGGRIPEAGGPEVVSLRDLAHQWLNGRKRNCLLIPMPALGGGLQALARVRSHVRTDGGAPFHSSNG